MKSAYILICISGALTSCVGDPQLVLHRPVMNRCIAAGLTDCRRVTQAALSYAEGNPVDGRRQLLVGLAQNRGKSNELERFALSLEQVSATSGGGEFQAPLQPAVYLVRQTAAREEQVQRSEPFTADQDAVAGRGEAMLLTTSVERPLLGAAIPAGESPPASVFFMLAGNALAGDCRFPSAPTMRCVHEDIEITRIVSDIIVSPACPYDVVFASRRGIDLDWATYAPAGKGAEVHGAQLPLLPGHTLTAGVGFVSDEAPPDVRCGITVVWRDMVGPTVRKQQTSKGLTMAPHR